MCESLASLQKIGFWKYRRTLQNFECVCARSTVDPAFDPNSKPLFLASYEASQAVTWGNPTNQYVYAFPVHLDLDLQEPVPWVTQSCPASCKPGPCTVPPTDGLMRCTWIQASVRTWSTPSLASTTRPTESWAVMLTLLKVVSNDGEVAAVHYALL